MIVTYPNNVLKERCIEVQDIDAAVIGDMLRELRESGGVGLAAPQIGSLQRIVVIDANAGTDKSNPLVMINPTISKSSKKFEEGIEACLSLPGRRFRVNRAKSVWVSFTDSTGKRTKRFSSGFEATIILHEIDHLNGITIADKGREVL